MDRFEKLNEALQKAVLLPIDRLYEAYLNALEKSEMAESYVKIERADRTLNFIHALGNYKFGAEWLKRTAI